MDGKDGFVRNLAAKVLTIRPDDLSPIAGTQCGWRETTPRVVL